GKFVCAPCGNKDAIIASIRKLPEDQRLPMNPYAIQGYCVVCAGDSADEDNENGHLFDESKPQHQPNNTGALVESGLLSKNGGKFFKRVGPTDLARYQTACQVWERKLKQLPYPKQEIPEGYNTNQMIKHNYRHWHQMFNPRQLLCVATLLKAIAEESDL